MVVLSYIKDTILNGFLRGSNVLESELIDCDTVLDVGCGSNSPYGYVRKKGSYAVGIDLHEQSIEESRNKGFHDDYVAMNVLDIDKQFKPGSFDAVVSLDVIEHLSKTDGYELLRKMDDIAKKKVIISTPNGFVPQPPTPDNPYQGHISGWDAAEMKASGFSVYGANGWKKLRGAYAGIKYKPIIFWKLVSLISQIYVKKRPMNAFHILCIKTKKQT